MDKQPQYTRPSFDEAVAAWKAILARRNLPTDLIWIFEENLCFEPDPASAGGFKLGFQIAFTPPPEESAQIAYDYYAEFDSRLVFYRLGTHDGKSLCLILCDAWFESRRESDGYERRDDWLMSFRPGCAETIEEIRQEERWKNRMIRNRPLHDLDFSMTLQAVHETLAHGRVLSNYEHYALRFLHLWRRILGQPK